MSEMVERVADAILATMFAENRSEVPSDFPAVYRARYIACARAAIAAMREPTAAMFEMAYGGVNCSDQDKAMQFYRDLIDEALK